MLTANDPWAKEVKNNNGQDRNVTTNEVDEGLKSTEKVEKTGELQEGLLGLHQKMDQLLEALCGRFVVKHTSSFAASCDRRPIWSSALGTARRCRRRSALRSPSVELSSVGGPRVSASSRSTARTCSPMFR